jgi:putative MATE family efflux protein
MGAEGETHSMCVTYLRISALGLPWALVALAGTGYLRGADQLRRPLVIIGAGSGVNVVLEVLFVYGFDWGLAGSAWGTVIAQTGMGIAFVVELLRPPADSRRFSLAEVRPLLRTGGDIFIRTAALLGSFTIASAVLARIGESSLAAHQIAFQLFIFLALVLDALAIAGQVLVGRALGSGDAGSASDAGSRLIGLSGFVGFGFGALLLLGTTVIPHAFTGDDAVIAKAEEIWPLFALMQPLGGAAFALDGVLIGAEDTRFLKWSMVVASVGVFVPVALAAYALDWGIVGVWAGLIGLMAARVILLGVRFARGRWAVVGAPA